MMRFIKVFLVLLVIAHQAASASLPKVSSNILF